MNKKDFKRYMQQGIGRCVLHEECRYDSNYEISEYVNRYYPVKK